MTMANEREHTDQDHLAMHTLDQDCLAMYILVHLFMLLVTYVFSWPIEDELATTMKSLKLK